ncbi:MAG: calcium/sodium antiporter [Candidatus Aminicenantes bacterium]|nr:calcium/sodium antiporter [Candidatus Aminicenantes bacterium]
MLSAEMDILSWYGALVRSIEGSTLLAWTALAAALVILSKSAGVFVDSSVRIAEKFKIPKVVIGIVLVSLATTAPELSVSLMSATTGKPEMALGNAIGSVICDDGLALGLAGLVSAAPILIMPVVLRISGIFLLCVEILAFLFVVFDSTLDRLEGAILVGLFFGYLAYLLSRHKRGKLQSGAEEGPMPAKKAVVPVVALLFVVSLLGIIAASKFIVVAAVKIAHVFRVPETVIALTVVAFGTSIPEVATCVVAARRKQGALAVGNIIGADIMNICWVAGASAVANPLVLGTKEILFMFPAMFVIVGAMLAMLRHRYSLTRPKGAVLLGLYVLYLFLAAFVMKFPA